MSTLYCKDCKSDKPTSEFYETKDKREFTYYCKPCMIARRHEYPDYKGTGVGSGKERKQKNGSLWCTGCESYKEPSNFYSDNKAKTERTSQCKECFALSYKQSPTKAKYKRTTEDVSCPICKLTKPSSEFDKSSNRPNGCSLKCKACFTIERRTPQRRFVVYRGRASRNKLAFDLTIESFTDITSQPCHYCNKIDDHVGIDRIDSTKGYVRGNMLPCCTACNRMKNSHSFEFFCEHVLAIASTLKRKGIPEKNTTK